MMKRKALFPIFLILIMLVASVFMPVRAEIPNPDDMAIAPVLEQAETAVSGGGETLPNIEDVGAKAFLKALVTWRNMLTAVIFLVGLIATAKFIGLKNSVRDLLMEIRESIDPESEAGKKISQAEANRIIQKVFEVLKEILLHAWNPLKFRFFKKII